MNNGGTMNTNAYGFPVTECDRCGGTGEYSYCDAYGKRCMKCNGTKFFVAKHAAKAWKAFQEAKKADAQRQISQVKIGDKLVQNSRASQIVEIKDDPHNAGCVRFILANGMSCGFYPTITPTVTIHNPDFNAAPFLATIKGAK